ncbi:MAG: reductive dehalogenase domain-containing protein [Dehalococcoidia bacterium]|nr:reductive dehalogenase domain-containing protein [Dehalococcoidia bacterium]
MIERAEKRDIFGGLTDRERRLKSNTQTNIYRDCIAQEQRGRVDGDVNPVRLNSTSAAVFSRMVKDKAKELGISAVGIAEVNQDYAYKDKSIPGKYAISLAMEMDKDKVNLAPGPEAEEEYWRVYYELGEANVKLAEFIREMGYPAYAHHPLGTGRLLMIPFAIASGIALLGRLGLAMAPKMGPRMRLACVTTDLPLAIDKSPTSHRAEFCDQCLACYKACPAQAIAKELTVERGIERYILDWQKCRSYSNYHNGCGICLKVCPYDRVMGK